MNPFIIQVKLKAMKSHEEQVERMNLAAKSLSQYLEEPEELQRTVADFNRRWAETFEKIGEWNGTIHAFECQ